jgi:uncharacterized protein YabN with tetrapyrrole methylase and pyrophosphatase domain
MRDIQNRVWKFCEVNKLNSHISERFVNLAVNLEKRSRNVLKLSANGKDSLRYKDELKLEVGELFFDIINISNTLNIDLNEALESVLDKKEGKLLISQDA